MVLLNIPKPKNCYNCRFNDSDCRCSIHKGKIDRDDYSNDKGCPMIEVDKNEVEHLLK